MGGPKANMPHNALLNPTQRYQSTSHREGNSILAQLVDPIASPGQTAGFNFLDGDLVVVFLSF